MKVKIDNDPNQQDFFDKYYNALVADDGLKYLSLEQVVEYAKNLLETAIYKDNYCERTYVKPRLNRVPDKIKFLSELIEAFEKIISSDFDMNYNNWHDGDYFFLTADAELDLNVNDEGEKFTELELWYQHYQQVLGIIYSEKVLDFLNELKYLMYLRKEKKKLLEQQVEELNTKNPLEKTRASAFIVHGRNTEVKETVARYLSKLEIKPTILSEQGGITSILDKFERCSEVDIAIILLTPDDKGAIQDEDKLNNRARQNVILELGYFISKLGKERVFVLVQGDIEKPSDYDGIMYIAYDDNGGWKLKLAREIKTIGIDIDLNQAI